MHRIFQTFVDRVVESPDASALCTSMADTAAVLDLHHFAYLCVPTGSASDAQYVSTYPVAWASRYLRNRYHRLDPVIGQARHGTEPFEWGLDIGWTRLAKRQCQLFDEAAQFGIRYGFTIPIHDARGPVAAVTFATDERRRSFQHTIAEHRRVLQLMAMYFHAHARRKLISNRVIDGVPLSPREFECLDWAARGKSAWEIGQILGISRRTAAFHLDNAKEKLGVHSICQAVARFAASKAMTH